MAHHVLSEVTARHVPSRCPLCMMDADSEVTSELHEGEAKSVLTEEQIRRYDAASLSDTRLKENQASVPSATKAAIVDAVEPKVYDLQPAGAGTGRFHSR